MNITANIQQPSARDFQVYMSRINDVEKAPLSERKANAQEWFEDLHDPHLIAERIDWLLDGSYGYAEYWKALQVLESPRMNRVAALSIMIAALEWNTPQRFAIIAWKQLTPKQQTDLKMEIQKIISDHVDKWSTEEGGKYVAGRCGGASLKKYRAYFNRFSIDLTKDQALSASHQGDCAEDVAVLLKEPALIKQLDKINPVLIRQELKEYGAWSQEELEDVFQNQARIVWLAAGQIKEEELKGV